MTSTCESSQCDRNRQLVVARYRQFPRSRIERRHSPPDLDPRRRGALRYEDLRAERAGAASHKLGRRVVPHSLRQPARARLGPRCGRNRHIDVARAGRVDPEIDLALVATCCCNTIRGQLEVNYNTIRGQLEVKYNI